MLNSHDTTVNICLHAKHLIIFEAVEDEYHIFVYFITNPNIFSIILLNLTIFGISVNVDLSLRIF